MKTISKYLEISENYINGNISDFRKQLKGLSKKELLCLEWQLMHSFGLSHDEANNAIHKNL
jgi:hypothetical protein